MTARLKDERGLTMVEMMVTMVVGLVVMFAIFNLVDSSTRLNAKVNDRVDTTQRARSSMDLISRQIRSQVCQGTGLPAMTEGTADTMTFYASLGIEQAVTGATATLPVQKRRLTFRPGTSGAAGSILEEVWNGTGQRPTVTFPTNPSTSRVIATGVNRSVVGGVTQPVFQYYRFAVPTGQTDAVPTLITTLPLNESDLARTVQVRVAYTAIGKKNITVPIAGDVYVRTSNPTNPDNSPLCL